jgi:hypothetical protein
MMGWYGHGLEILGWLPIMGVRQFSCDGERYETSNLHTATHGATD